MGELRRHVRPAAVVVTGDLTDAKTEDHVGSGQLRAEWEQYREVGAVCLIMPDHKLTIAVLWRLRRPWDPTPRGWISEEITITSTCHIRSTGGYKYRHSAFIHIFWMLS